MHIVKSYGDKKKALNIDEIGDDAHYYDIKSMVKNFCESHAGPKLYWFGYSNNLTGLLASKTLSHLDLEKQLTVMMLFFFLETTPNIELRSSYPHYHVALQGGPYTVPFILGVLPSSRKLIPFFQ